MEKPKILVTARALINQPTTALVRLEKEFTVELADSRGILSEEELIANLPGVCATIAGMERYSERVFEACPELRIIARYGVGYDQIDVASASRHGVVVAMTFGVNENAVADYAFALICAVRRGVLKADRDIRRGIWRVEFLPGLWRSTIGIVGLGRIGKCMVRRARGFDMRIVAAELRPELEFVKANKIDLVSLDELFGRADIVTLHIPSTSENMDIVDRRTLALMKPSAILVNTARGSLVDEEALYEALTMGRIAGAGLDVFKREPPTGSPLLELNNVVLGPHCGSCDLTAHESTVDRCVDNVLRFFRGEPLAPGDILNPEVLQGRRIN